MVVKNVTGYDLHKGHIGALGTLGLITRVNLKVAPLPTNERTAVYGFASALDAGGAVGSIVSLPVSPTAVDLIDRRLVAAAEVPDRPWLLAARFAGTEAGVAAQLAMVHEALASNGAAPNILEREAQRDFWRDAVSVAEPPPIRRAVYGVPHERPLVADSIVARVRGGRRRGARLGVARGGSRRERRGAGALDGRGQRRGLPRRLRSSRRAAQMFDAPVVVEAAPPAVKRRLDVWGADPSNAAHALADSSCGRRSIPNARSIRDAFWRMPHEHPLATCAAHR